ncbi:MAG: GtrA family protein [Ruminococcaceae bacterium]|nr:GtrA family protein [Oscillospiraceae bacterium]
MEMLIYSGKLFSSIIEEPIKTIYIDNNSGSHFNPVKDGLKIYSVLFSNLPSFMMVSVASFVIDYLLFNLLYYVLLGNTAVSTVAARVASSLFNFTLNKKLVFKSSSEKYNIINYYKLAVFILVANMALMALLVDFLHVPAFLAKILVECVLYIVSFTTQNKWSKS